MKKLITLFLTIPLVFVSCISEVGPPGLDGLDGADGLIGTVVEVPNVDFTSGNGFQVFDSFPNNLQVLDSDVVIAYILTGVDNGVDIWEPLPQTLFFEDGILLYTFNHTSSDISFFLDGTVNLEALDPDLTQGLTFRYAIIPADQAELLDFNTLSMTDLIGSMQNKTIVKLN